MSMWCHRILLVLCAAALTGTAWAAAPDPACSGGAWPLPVQHLGGDDSARVWVLLSPRMPWALSQWAGMSAVGRDLGLKVQPVRDPRVPGPEWRAAVRAAGLPELLCTPVMDMELARAHGLLHHAPSALVQSCGQVHPWPILGVMPDPYYAKLLKQRLAQLELPPCTP